MDKAKKVNRIEECRATWATPKNLKTHFDMVEEILIDTGIGEKSDTFDPEYTFDYSKNAPKHQPAAESVRILHPGRILSYDETSLTVDMTSCGGRTMLSGKDDEGVCLAAKSSCKCTGVGGSLANGESLPGYFIFPVAPELHWIEDDCFKVPSSTKKDPRTGKGFPAKFHHNKSGGADHKFGLKYFEFLMEGTS